MGLAPTSAWAVSALSFIFTQGGYAEGATVSGSFAGIDADDNGILVHFPLRGGDEPPIAVEELSAFSMHFSGNSLAPAFDLSLDELFGFVYEIGSAGIGDDPAFDPTIDRDLIEGVGAVGDNFFYTTGLGPNGMIGGLVGDDVDVNNPSSLEDNALDSSSDLAVVTPVPEPAGPGALLIGCAGLIYATRRQRSS
jgi:hypothetical protein